MTLSQGSCITSLIKIGPELFEICHIRSDPFKILHQNSTEQGLSWNHESVQIPVTKWHIWIMPEPTRFTLFQVKKVGSLTTYTACVSTQYGHTCIRSTCGEVTNIPISEDFYFSEECKSCRALETNGKYYKIVYTIKFSVIWTIYLLIPTEPSYNNIQMYCIHVHLYINS